MKVLYSGLCIALCCSFASPLLYAQEKLSPEAEAKLKATVDRGFEFLTKSGQAEDGTFSAKAGPGITALAVTAALRHGKTLEDPLVAKGLAALDRFVKPDGGIYGDGRLKNYETCVAVLCYGEANKDGRYNKILENAKTFLKQMQLGGPESSDSSDPWYGGSGYAGAGRPDLSNTAYMIEALHSLGVSPSDPGIQRALLFVSRCQNLKSQHNDLASASKVNDGGFYYTVPNEKNVETQGGVPMEDGGVRSYGSMTYNGLKSMIYAGLAEDDPRVKSALKWIAQHYTLESNPGYGNAGLYYYYHTFAAALKAARLEVVADSDGKEHPWKDELITELAERQTDDGSWTNTNQRWFEGDANLSTSFALLALAYCK